MAWAGDYAGEIGFLARLTRPVETIIEPEVAAWLAAHPGGIVLDKRFTADKAAMLPAPDRELPYRSKRLALWIAPGTTAECR